MKKILIMIVCCLIMQPAFAGFKTVSTKCLNSWVGYSIDKVISVWGYPTSKNEFAGKKVYCWEHNQPYLYSTQYGVYGGTNTCTRILEVNDENIVVGGEMKGNSCPSTYCGIKKWVNPDNNPWQIEKAEKKQAKQLKKEEKELLKQYKQDLKNKNQQ